MDPYNKSKSFYELESSDYDSFSSKPILNASHSFAYGSYTRDSFHDFSEFKTSIEETTKINSIQEEPESNNKTYFS